MEEIIHLEKFKWAKKCAKCGKEIQEGTAGFWNKTQKLYYHDNGKCYDAPPTTNQSKGAGPQTPAPSGKPGQPTFSLETELKINADLFHRARVLVDKEFEAEPKDYSLYQVSVAAVFTALSKKRELAEKAATWGDKMW